MNELMMSNNMTENDTWLTETLAGMEAQHKANEQFLMQQIYKRFGANDQKIEELQTHIVSLDNKSIELEDKISSSAQEVIEQSSNITDGKINQLKAEFNNRFNKELEGTAKTYVSVKEDWIAPRDETYKTDTSRYQREITNVKRDKIVELLGLTHSDHPLYRRWSREIHDEINALFKEYTGLHVYKDIPLRKGQDFACWVDTYTFSDNLSKSITVWKESHMEEAFTDRTGQTNISFANGNNITILPVAKPAISSNCSPFVREKMAL